MSTPMDPQHTELRSALRFIGPLVVVIGALFCAVGFISFFSSFGQFGGTPKNFWCAFIGLPLVGIGLGICKFAYLGAIQRYIANEAAPVGKDVVNYMATNTRGAIREVAAAVGEGLRSASSTEAVRCRKCNADNESTANFCKDCGASMAGTVPCASCGDLNSPSSRFCDNCGRPI